MCIMDPTEFSDHSPIVFALRYSLNDSSNTENRSFEKVVWDTSDKPFFLESIYSKASALNDIVGKLELGECDINQCISSFTAIVQNVSFACFGKTVNTYANDKQRKPKKIIMV